MRPSTLARPPGPRLGSAERNAAEFAKDVLYKWLWLGKPAPAIEGKDLAGSPFGPAEHRGKVVVLYFFSSRVKEFAVEAFVLRRLVRSVPATDLAVVRANGQQDEVCAFGGNGNPDPARLGQTVLQHAWDHAAQHGPVV